MDFKRVTGLIAGAFFGLIASGASADCDVSVTGARVGGADNVYINIPPAAGGTTERTILLCSLSSGAKCEAWLDLAEAAVLSQNPFKLASGNGTGTCDEYVAGTRAIAYVLLKRPPT